MVCVVRMTTSPDPRWIQLRPGGPLHAFPAAHFIAYMLIPPGSYCGLELLAYHTWADDPEAGRCQNCTRSRRYRRSSASA